MYAVNNQMRTEDRPIMVKQVYTMENTNLPSYLLATYRGFAYATKNCITWRTYQDEQR